ncbi:hypothetical protein [Rubripirellula tenax]|nr:hypothetical protein [Rubripirellula tenax]
MKSDLQDDEFTLSAARWLQTSKDGHVTHRHTTEHDFTGAVEIHENAELRLQVEARLLSKQPTERIAALSNVSSHAVETYIQLFFDVIGKMNARSWIASHVFDGHNGEPVSLTSVILQNSYRGGPIVCEHYLVHYRFVGVGIHHDMSTEVGRQRVQLELDFQSFQPMQNLSLRQVSALHQLGSDEEFSRPTTGGLRFETDQRVLDELAHWVLHDHQESQIKTDDGFEEIEKCWPSPEDVA